ncbi:protein cueball-like [Lasioglossum baleicum]|uniref:protein cueball-like n=1 Tax=Lasioglossum baleicum TaxID=434251 RepID=UPI003FCE0B76
MTSRKNFALILTIVLGIFAINTHARSWDLAVVIGREVEFFSTNKTLTGQAKLAEAATLWGVTYDDITRTMYFSDVGNNNISIFSNDLRDKNFTVKPLLKKKSRSYIVGLAFDIKTRTLFWSDALERVIMKMHVPLDGPPEKPMLLHNLTNLSPRGIALDTCNSRIYWVNSNDTNPSIERSNLDGSNRMTVIKDNLYEPLAVTIDHVNEKLYWIDDVEGIRMKIERSNLDGTDRELLIHPKRHEPVHLAVDRDSIYWSDSVHKAVWMIPKNEKSDNTPIMFRSYHSSQDTDPAGIVTRDNVGNVDCTATAKVRQKTSLAFAKMVEPYNNLTTSTEESELTTEPSKHCLNDGYVDDQEDACQCKLGFTGTYCETDLCHNYCFRGSCSIDTNGLPTCKCNDTFIGPRCETDLCKDYCLHDGQCSVQNEKPVCKCKYFEGSRCEILSNITVLCEVFCANTESVPTSVATANCRCAEENERFAQIVTIRQNDEYRTLLPILGVFVLVLILVIIVLSYYVNKFRKRPRIKKRFVVSKGGVTPLTSRPQLPDSQCEITIENCCNMNICETPCFEPKLRTSAPGTNGSKKEEKNSLLDNMEENSW